MRSASKILLRLPLKNVFACPLCPACGQPVASRRCAVRRQRSLDRLVAHRCDERSAIPLKGGHCLLRLPVARSRAPLGIHAVYLLFSASCGFRRTTTTCCGVFKLRKPDALHGHSPSALVGRRRSPGCVVRSSRMRRPTFISTSRASGGCSLAEVLLHQPTS